MPPDSTEDKVAVYRGRVGLQQRVLPAYRAAFFDRLASACGGRLEIFAGEPAPDESIRQTPSLSTPWRAAKNIHVGRGRTYFCLQRGLLQWLRNWRPDVLIVEANPRVLSTYLGILQMKARKQPVLGWGVGVLDWRAPRWLLSLRKAWLRMFCGRFDGVIAYSGKAARDYEEAGIPRERIFIAHNAVSGEEAERLASRLAEAPELIGDWKHEIGLCDTPIVLYVGRLLASKRVGDLIRACVPLAQDCQLLIVGEGRERSSLEDLAANLPPQVRFLGERTGQDLAMCFAAAALFVLPGTGGLAVHEAMIHGKPVIVASGDGTQGDLVRDGENGFLVTAGDTPAITEAIRDLLQDERRCAEMGAVSRSIAAERYTLDAMVDSFMQAVQFVTAGTPGK